MKINLYNPKIILFCVLLTIISNLLTACTSITAQAPVYNLWYQPISSSGNYTVKPHDTLYSIAWNFGMDYQNLAAINQLKSPFTIIPGQLLTLKSPGAQKILTHHLSSVNKGLSPVNKAPQRLTQNNIIHHWVWPARGQISTYFSTKPTGNKGINIEGHLGEPILAAAPGIVVYCGAGVRGYGKLIILKHNNQYLSAYAYNQKILVKQGEKVHSGQRIALMGKNNGGQPLLHFEIRRQGIPANPMHFLPRNTG